MLLVYSHKTSNRLKFTLNLILKDILGIGYTLTNNKEEFVASTMPKMSYTYGAIANELFFESRSLLYETGITDQNITVFEWNENKIFFAVGKNSTLPFDPFAASFYLASRYEEYLPHIRDEYDRFDAKYSLAFQNSFLQKPVINYWAKWIKEKLREKYPELEFSPQKYSFISTIDIDNAYAYKEKGFMRNLGGYLKAISNFRFHEIAERTKVLLGLMQDPYDTYDYQLAIQKKYKFNAIYFFLLGDYGVNDKNLPVENLNFQILIKKLSDYAQVGIHPSFGSNSSKAQLKKEIARLSKILHRDITQSRQHFLKLSLPETYRNLIDLDIAEDYTMGFASQIGFRASICTPFYFYDLDNELETKLKIFPFAFMEGTLKYYMKIDAEQALDHILPLIKEVKALGGTFVSLWHNETLTDENLWKGWRNVYEKMIEEAVS